MVGATLDFVKGVGHMVLGSIMISYGAVERGLQRVMTGINGMADAMKVNPQNERKMKLNSFKNKGHSINFGFIPSR